MKDNSSVTEGVGDGIGVVLPYGLRNDLSLTTRWICLSLVPSSNPQS